MTFVDLEFDFALDGFSDVTPSVSITHPTMISFDSRGKEYKVKKNIEGQASFSIDSIVYNDVEIESIIAFYEQMQGTLKSFKFKNPLDYENYSAPNYKIIQSGTSYVYRQIRLYPLTENDSSAPTQFYAVQLYIAGNMIGFKAINKIDINKSFSIYRRVDNQYVQNEFTTTLIDPNSYTVNFNTGLVVFNSGISLTRSTLTVNCSYFNEVRFDSPLEIDDLGAGNFKLKSLKLLEVLSSRNYIPVPASYYRDDLAFTYDLNVLPANLIKREFRHSQGISQDSKTEVRRARYITPTTTKTLSSYTLLDEEDLYIYTLFLAAKGTYSIFRESNVTSIRFNSDTLTFKVLVNKTVENGINISQNVKVIENFDVKVLSSGQSSLRLRTMYTLDGRFATGQMLYLIPRVLPLIISRANELIGDDVYVDSINRSAAGNDSVSMENWLDVAYKNANIGNLIRDDYWLVIWCYSFYPDSINSPSSTYLADLQNVINQQATYGKYKILLVLFDDNNSSVTANAKTHLNNALFGLNGFPSLSSIGSVYSISGLRYDLSDANSVLIADTIIQAITQVSLVGESSSLCTCVYLELASGEKYGFTSLDKDLYIDGLLYKSSVGLDPTAIKKDAQSSVDNLEVTGLLDGVAFDRLAIIGGLFDRANIVVSRINYTSIPSTILLGEILIQGQVGNVTQTDSKLTLEVRSLIDLLSKSITKKVSPLCTNSYGDSKCGIDIESTKREITANVNNGTSAVQIKPVGGFGNDFIPWIYGEVVCIEGNNKGLRRYIIDLSDESVLLDNGFPYSIEPGSRYACYRNCTRTIEACGIHNNKPKFRGFPPVTNNFVPGADRLSSGE